MLKTQRNRPASDTDGAAMEAAQALARKVAESDTYKAFESSSAAFRGDAEAQRLFRAYQTAQRENQMMRGWGGSDKGSEGRIQRLEKELFAHPTLKRYISAQEDLLAALKELNGYLTEKLGFDFADLTKPAGGCC